MIYNNKLAFMGLGGTTHSRTIMRALKSDNNNNDKIFISDLNH